MDSGADNLWKMAAETCVDPEDPVEQVTLREVQHLLIATAEAVPK